MKVLVVEDDPGVVDILRLALQVAGHTVLEARDGLQAYELFAQQHPDAIVLDLRLPQITGFRLVQLFREERPDIPIIVTTGLTFEEAEEVARYHIDAFLSKPFDIDQFIKTLNSLLSSSTRPQDPGSP
jgi:DNA-binding response OmpR family regulator